MVKVFAPRARVVPATASTEVSEMPAGVMAEMLNCAPVVERLTAPAREPAPLRESVPAATVVVPVCKFAPERIRVPAPAFVRAPVEATLAPLIVNVFVVTLMVLEVPALRVKLRFVVAVAPVYWRVPPFSTKLPAAVLACPRLPATPPFPIVATERMPSVIVVTPV